MNNEVSIVINEADNVATALCHLKAGQEISVKVGKKVIFLTLKEDINVYHKFSLYDILKDEKVYKYAQVIGESECYIDSGRHVHIHNMRSLRG